VRLIRRELDGRVPLIGFSGSPWTLACYMVEGGGSKDWGKVKALALNEPAAMHQLLSVVTDAVIAYLSAQHAAGAQALQVFDTWGGTLGPAMYREFSLPYLVRIARALKDLGAPVILFGKGNAPHLDDLFAASGASSALRARRDHVEPSLLGCPPRKASGASSALRARRDHVEPSLLGYRRARRGASSALRARRDLVEPSLLGCGQCAKLRKRSKLRSTGGRDLVEPSLLGCGRARRQRSKLRSTGSPCSCRAELARLRPRKATAEQAPLYGLAVIT
jgi:hypothetical protein